MEELYKDDNVRLLFDEKTKVLEIDVLCDTQHVYLHEPLIKAIVAKYTMMLPDELPSRRSFGDNLKDLINTHSLENGSNTPDFILCSYLMQCLSNFNATVSSRDGHLDRKVPEDYPRYSKKTPHPKHDFREYATEILMGDTDLEYHEWVCEWIEREKEDPE